MAVDILLDSGSVLKDILVILMVCNEYVNETGAIQIILDQSIAVLFIILIVCITCGRNCHQVIQYIILSLTLTQINSLTKEFISPAY